MFDINKFTSLSSYTGFLALYTFIYSILFLIISLISFNKKFMKWKNTPAIITLIILYRGGRLNSKTTKKKLRWVGVFDYKPAAEGIANNYIDAVDLLYIMLNRPRFKADVQLDKFYAEYGRYFWKNKRNVRREFLLKTAFTDPYFTEAQLFGGTIYAAYSDKNIQTVANLLKLTNLSRRFPSCSSINFRIFY